MVPRWHRLFAPVRLILVASAVAVVLLAGCEGGTECLEASRIGTELARAGLPPDGTRKEIRAHCLGAFDSAWASGINDYCDPEQAFDIGYSDAVYYGVCLGEAFNRNYRLGRTLWVLEVEREALGQRLEAIEAGHAPADPGEAGSIRMRIRVLERDIPELMTLARQQGLMAPAEAPVPEDSQAPDQ